MCDLTMALGIMSAGVGAMGAANVASKNTKIIKDQAKLEHASQERELLVETNASNKEAYQAQLQEDRAVAHVNATGKGSGNTMGLRAAEQARQGALSIANAKDRTDAARSNYTAAGQHTKIAADNRIEVEQAKAQGAIMNSFANAFG